MAGRPHNGSIGRVGQRRQVVIPQAICEELKIAVGDFVAIERRAGLVVIRPQRVADRDDTLTDREAASVRQGLKDAAAGRVTGWSAYARKRAVGHKTRQASR